ncbi:hypothetical protein BLS_004633 [Venturia inaequalis]|uniref:Uncharacterized protein n=1 Tax=Venturia inaequalis TaxID=5025 RepID=A0A8H3YVY3_VENIN|nr:hypothetical protein BLS_004633 [Venturia inaequalis]
MSITPSESQISLIYINASIVFGTLNTYNLTCKVTEQHQFFCTLRLADDTELIHTRPFSTAQEAWNDIDNGLQKEVDRRFQAERQRILGYCQVAWGKDDGYTIVCSKDDETGLWKARVENGDGSYHGETAAFETEAEAWSGLDELMEIESKKFKAMIVRIVDDKLQYEILPCETAEEACDALDEWMKKEVTKREKERREALEKETRKTLEKE